LTLAKPEILKKKSHENTAPMRTLVGLIFARNKICSTITTSTKELMAYIFPSNETKQKKQHCTSVFIFSTFMPVCTGNGQH